MNEEDIKCECGKLYKEKEFKNHFKNCIKLHEKYEEFDAKIIHLLKKYIISKDSLLIIKFFLKRFIKIFDYKLKKIFNIQAIPSIKIENEPHKNLLNSKEIRDKIALFCSVKPECVIENVSLPSLYAVPLMLENTKLSDIVVKKLL